MKKSYYVTFDVSVDYKNLSHACYFSVSDNADVFGLVWWLFVNTYHHDPNNIRLFRFPTKKAWEDSRRDWINSVNLNSLT